MKTVYQDASVEVSIAEATGDIVLVAFTGVGHALGGVDVQQPEFLSACSLGTVIWVTDKNRTWGNGLDLDRISEVVLSYAHGKDTYCVGNSMGGFLAILMSKRINAKKVLALVPQWSIDKSIVPFENRWMEYRDKISEIKHSDLSNSFSKNCNYSILMGAHPCERQHTLNFLDHANTANIEVVEFSDCAHDVAIYLKKKNLLSGALKEFFSKGASLTKFLELNSININKNVNIFRYINWMIRSRIIYFIENRRLKIQ